MESKIKELEVNGIKYVPKDSVPQTELKGDIKIVILQRGWVMVGRLERNGSECKLHNASTIRIWGTKHGLGELTKNGVLKDTVIDKCNGLVEFDYLTVVATISCEEKKWENVL
jgi:hypothetical protein